MFSKRYPLTTDQIVNRSGLSGAFLTDALDAGWAIAEYMGPATATNLVGLTDVVFGTTVRETHSGVWGIATDGHIDCYESGETLVLASCTTDITSGTDHITRWLPYVWSGSSWGAKTSCLGWNFNRSASAGENTSARQFSVNAVANTTRFRIAAAEVVGANAQLAQNGTTILLMKRKN